MYSLLGKRLNLCVFYYEKLKPNSIKNNTNKFIIEKKTDIDYILKKLFN